MGSMLKKMVIKMEGEMKVSAVVKGKKRFFTSKLIVDMEGVKDGNGRQVELNGRQVMRDMLREFDVEKTNLKYEIGAERVELENINFEIKR